MIIDGTKVNETDEQRRIRLGLAPAVEPEPEVANNDHVTYKYDPQAGKVVAKARAKKK